MKRPALLFLEIALLCALGYWVYASLTETQKIDRPGGVEVTVQLPDAWDKAILYHADNGEYRYVITQQHDNQKLDLTANELADRVMRGRKERSWGQKVLNVSSPMGYLWVGPQNTPYGFIGGGLNWHTGWRGLALRFDLKNLFFMLENASGGDFNFDMSLGLGPSWMF